MTASTQILPFSTLPNGSGGNRLTPTAYAALTTILAQGFQAGLAPSEQLNTVWAQSSFMAAGLANFCVAQGISVPDDGNLTNLVTEIENAISAFVSSTLPSRTKLLTNANFYVTTSGNDSTGNGTSGAPWLTLQHAVNAVTSNYDGGGNNATINLGTGSFAGANITQPFMGGTLYINGNGSSNTNITSAIVNNNNAIVIVENATMATSGYGIQSYGGGSLVTVGAGMVFGACTTAHLSAFAGGSIAFNAGYTVSGNTSVHLQAYDGGKIINGQGALTVNISTAVSITEFVAGNTGGIIDFQSVTFTNPSNVTGQRYNANTLSIINTGSSGSATYFPGSSPGTVNSGPGSNGGIYL